MIISIPDNLDPEEKRKRLAYDPIFYALKIHKNNIKKAADFLGFSGRAIRNRMRVHPELKDLIRPKINQPLKEELKINALIKKRDEMIKKFLSSFDCNRMSKKEIAEKIEIIKKTYSEDGEC